MNRTGSRIARVAALLCAVAPPARAGDEEAGLTLVTDGRSQHAIVQPADASPSQLHAARELRDHVRQMTGVTLPIVNDEQPLPARAILLGMTRHTAAVLGGAPDLGRLGDDGFRLVTRPPHLLIVAGPVRGTLYGVHELLEREGGCGWYARHHTVIPRRSCWTIGAVDRTETPAFVMREPFWWGMFDGDLAARNRVNGNRADLTDKHGGKIRFGGGLFVHTFYPLMPPGEFFAAHPEYYSEIDGKRTADRAQLCLTHPEVARIVTERVLGAIRSDPGAKLFSVSQNDWAGWCRCARCRAVDEREGSPSGTMIEFVNRIAEAVEKEFPHVWIETLAYQYTRHPPRTVRPRRNVVPRLCTIECDFSRPLPESDDPENRRFVDDIRGWAALTDKLYVWDYTTNFGHYLLPHPNFGALQGNARFFREHGVVGLFEQGAYQSPHAEFAELRAWILAKLLWDPDEDLPSLYDDFFSGYYGAAAGPVRRYFEELQARARVPGRTVRIWAPPSAPWLDDEFLERAARTWAEAERLVAADPQRLYNVRMSALPVLYARLARRSDPLPTYAWHEGWLRPRGVDPAYGTLARDFLDRLAEGRVTRVAESEERNEMFLAGVRGRIDGYRGRDLGDAGCRASVVPELGGRVAALAGPDGCNLLEPDAGGIDFADAASGLDSISNDPWRVVRPGPTQLILRRETRGRERIERALRVDRPTLAIATEWVNLSTAPRRIDPVARFALALGQGAALRRADGSWLSLAPAPDARFASESIVPAPESGGELLFASADARRSIALRLPSCPVSRVWMLADARRGSVRVHMVPGPRTLEAGGTLTFTVEARPAPGTAAPTTVPACEKRGSRRIVIEDCMMRLGRPGQWGEIVPDPGAEDGFAARLFNTHHEWCLTWPIDPALFDPGIEYRVRARIRVGRTGRDGIAFWAGVYDATRKRGVGSIEPRAAQLTDGYRWYDIARWVPESGQYVWIGPGRPPGDGRGPAIEAVYVDRCEIAP